MRTDSIRPAAVAGSWYPGTRGALERDVDGYLEAVGPDALPRGRLDAVIVPHAGLMFSGPVGAYSYKAADAMGVHDTIVLVGPSHFAAFDGVALYPSGGFDTPAGVMSIDAGCARAIAAASPVVHEHPCVHVREHSLEMQLPFLSRLAPAVPIVPLLMGYQTAETAAALGAALATALNGRKALLIASTDLSHYHDAKAASALDRVVIDCVARFDADGLQAALSATPEHACGGGPVVAVMRAARAAGARDARILNYADSGDVSGDKSSVVGYLAAALGTFDN